MRVSLLESAARNQNVAGWLRVGKLYTVLAVEIDAQARVLFRVEGEGGTPALFEPDIFNLESRTLPSS